MGQGKKQKTSKYYGVSKIGKRFRAMFAGKYIGMADKEIDAARMVNEWCKKCGVEPENKMSEEGQESFQKDQEVHQESLQSQESQEESRQKKKIDSLLMLFEEKIYYVLKKKNS